MLRIASRLACVCALSLSVVMPAAADETLDHGRFEQLRLLEPQGEPKRVVLWFAGQGDAGRRDAQARALRDDGALVAMVDTARLYRTLASDTGDCVFSAGDVENVSRYVQAYRHMATYHLPLLVGDGDGAALAYAIAAQAGPDMLAGVLTDGVCPASVPARAICGPGVAGNHALQPAPLKTPWLASPAAGAACPARALDGLITGVPQARTFKRSSTGDWLPGLRAAARSLGDRKGASLPPPPADLDGLPVVEVPASADAAGDTFAIFVSGDGGWAGLDKEVAAALAQDGIPVVGVDALRYFWSERTPQGFAADIDRIVRFYSHRWNRRRVLLIGFSQGADVLPAAINQLPDATRRSVRMTALLSTGRYADYEFHVSNWIGSDDEGLPIAPQIARLDAASTLCVYGVDDKDTLCPQLPADATQRIALPGDHHFKGDYARLAEVILEQLRRR